MFPPLFPVPVATKTEGHRSASLKCPETYRPFTMQCKFSMAYEVSLHMLSLVQLNTFPYRTTLPRQGKPTAP